jgi:dipeptidyl aminopeptidase/acylaminoacyl peptidase
VKAFMGGSDNMTEETLRQASPLYHVSKSTAPTLLLHGSEDALVPIEQSWRYAAELQKVNVEVRLVTLAGAHHNFAGEYEAQALREVLPFLQRHLGRLPLATQGR